VSKVAWYVGVPGSGKTILATQEALADVAATGRPLIVIDPEGVYKPGADEMSRKTIPVIEPMTSRQAVTEMYQSGKFVRVIPEDEEDVAWLCRALKGGMNAVVIIDEASYYTRSSSIVPDLAKLLRVRRHVNVSIYATTQYVGDLAPVALQCATDIVAFRTTSQRGLDRLSVEYRLNPDELQALEVGQFKRWSAWGNPTVLPVPPRVPPAAP